MKDNEYLEKIVSEQWNYVESLLRNAGVTDDFIKIAGFHYTTAFRHGFKHGVEWVMERNVPIIGSGVQFIKEVKDDK